MKALPNKQSWRMNYIFKNLFEKKIQKKSKRFKKQSNTFFLKKIIAWKKKAWNCKQNLQTIL